MSAKVPRALRTLAIERWEGVLANARPHFRAEFVQKMCALFDRFHDEGLADREFAAELGRGSKATYEQRMAEMLLADELWRNGFALRSAPEGPDFYASRDGNSAWIELITPEPTGIDASWLAASGEGVFDFPHEQLSLRWTAAIKEKFEKLVGNSANGKKGYLEKGIVKPHESYVIAVNQHLLCSRFRSITGISQIPFACEVLFAVGPKQLHIDPISGSVVDSDYQHRPHVKNARSALVPSDSFFNPAFSGVSAVWAVDLMIEPYITPDPGVMLPREHLSAVAYNPSATNPIRERWLPSQSHWRVTMGADHYTVESI